MSKYPNFQVAPQPIDPDTLVPDPLRLLFTRTGGKFAGRSCYLPEVADGRATTWHMGYDETGHLILFATYDNA